MELAHPLFTQVHLSDLVQPLTATASDSDQSEAITELQS